MPRRREIAKREVLPDPLYNSQLVTKFVNVVMRDGKKSVAERILYDALEVIRERTQDDPMKVFKKAVENVKPSVEVKSRRVGGSNYQVPVEVRPSRKLALSMRWIIQSAQKRGEKTMKLKLAGELVGGGREPWWGNEEEGGHPPHGRSQQGLRALPLVGRARSSLALAPGAGLRFSERRSSWGRKAARRALARERCRCEWWFSASFEDREDYGETNATKRHPQHRHHGSHRCR